MSIKVRMMPETRYLTKKHAAAYLDCSVDTIERMIADGLLTPRRLRGTIRLDKTEIDAYMAGGRRRRRRSP